MLFELAVKNIVSRKSSFVIILFIAMSVALLVLINSVFDRTEHGVEEVFINSFTGDLIIRPKSKIPLSLFGDETPVTGTLTKLENLVPYDGVCGVLSSNPHVKSFIPQVSGLAVAENKENRLLVHLFGVDGAEFAKHMPSLRVVEGSPYVSGSKGAMLLKTTAASLGVSVGDMIQFSVVDGLSARIRAVPVSAIYDYTVLNTTLERYMLLDPPTLRSLTDMGETASDIEIDDSASEILKNAAEIDSLFDGANDVDAVIREDIEAPPEDSISGGGVEGSLSDNAALSAKTEFEGTGIKSGSWNFIIVRLDSGKNAGKVIRAVNKIFHKNDWPVEAVGWRHAAGNSAMYLYWMRIIFNIGVLIILSSGFIVVNNTLVINVLDRIREIGTMRAVGASGKYVSLLFMLETFMITFVAGILGCLIGSLASFLLTRAHIAFSNSFLIQLFGGNTLAAKITFSNLRNSLGMSLILGVIGWIYPVRAALSISPVQAIQGAR
ncbi:ABC transporter permease [Treponema parvum]|uniref:ABC transporter permease n=1 Tax=Treponema parvum TaxID=138851 RepID=UPI00211DC0BD|nr:FtsX-like permease family protein [Treponema parvum]